MELYDILSPLLIGLLLLSTLRYRRAYLNEIEPCEVSDADIESIELSQSKLQLLNYCGDTNVGLSD
jgi:hypothetical protein